MNRTSRSLAAFLATLSLPLLALTPASAQDPAMMSDKMMDDMAEAGALQAQAARESGRPAFSPLTAVQFKKSDNVFLKSALAVNFTYRAAFVTLPLFRGLSPQGQPVDYIITEASDFDVAKKS